jgi:hypothetical protein
MLTRQRSDDNISSGGEKIRKCFLGECEQASGAKGRAEKCLDLHKGGGATEEESTVYPPLWEGTRGDDQDEHETQSDVLLEVNMDEINWIVIENRRGARNGADMTKPDLKRSETSARRHRTTAFTG